MQVMSKPYNLVQLRKIQSELGSLANPLRDPEPLREVVDKLINHLVQQALKETQHGD